MKYAAIYSALVTRYEAGAFGLPTAYPNKQFEPVGQDAYAQILYLPADVTPVSSGPTGLDLHEGIMQITLRYPSDKGQGDLLAKADQIAQHFRAGSERPVYDGQDVILRGVRCSPPTVIGGWLVAAVSINYSAYVRRA